MDKHVYTHTRVNNTHLDVGVCEAPCFVTENIVNLVEALVFEGCSIHSIQPVWITTETQELSLKQVNLKRTDNRWTEQYLKTFPNSKFELIIKLSLCYIFLQRTLQRGQAILHKFRLIFTRDMQRIF